MVETGSIADYVTTALSRNSYDAKLSLVTLTRRLVERQMEERKGNEVNFNDPKMYRANQEKAKLMAFKERVSDATSALTKARSGIEFIERYLSEMKTSLETLGASSTAEERAAVAAEFDDKLRMINAKADGANQTVNYRSINLIGNTDAADFTTDKLFTPYNRSGSFLEVEGVYLGSHFTVEEADGTVWRLSGDTTKFIQYPGDGSGLPTGSEIATEGLTIDSYDSSTGAVTYGGTGSLTGTLNRQGLDLLDSTYYNDFADDASVSEALTDIDAAISAATAGGAFIKAKSASLTANVDMAKEQIAKLEKEVSALVKQNVSEVAAVTQAAQLKMAMTINNVNMLSANNDGLVENMMQLISGGPGKALGVFGLMGY